MVDHNSLTASELLSCMELGKALTSELHSEDLFSKILHKISELLPAENWSLLLLDEATGELHFEVSVDLDLEKVRDVRLRLGQGIAGKAALEQEPVVIEDVTKCEFFSGQVDQISGCSTRSIICVPLVFGGRTVGVIEVVNPKNLEGDPLPLLSIIADYAAIAVENMRRYREIQNLAIHDDLTGLYNTRHLYRVLGSPCQNGRGDQGSLFPDFYGHRSFQTTSWTLTVISKAARPFKRSPEPSGSASSNLLLVWLMEGMSSLRCCRGLTRLRH